MEISRLCYLMLFLLGLEACHHPPVHLLLPARSGSVKLEVDSLLVPQLASFPIRLKLTNYTRHKVVLVFDSLPTGHHYQARNFYLVAGHDTFFLGMRVPNHHWVFAENTATSFLGEGYFLRGKSHFDSFGQIDSVIRYGKLVYTFAPPVPRGVDLAVEAPPVDTLLLPTKLEASTAHAAVVYRFLPISYEWREERLN
jgi:hypothetical protein